MMTNSRVCLKKKSQQQILTKTYLDHEELEVATVGKHCPSLEVDTEVVVVPQGWKKGRGKNWHN